MSATTKIYADAEEKFGGTAAEGAFSPKDATDLMELNLNRSFLGTQYNPNVSSLSAKMSLMRLSMLVSGLPTQTRRTDEQERYQQFSTPPHYAYAAVRAAAIKPDDVVLEPSAGVGGLAVFAKNAGARLILNELSDRRADLLASLNIGDVSREDAEQLHNLLNERPDVVVMNPPFTAAAGRNIEDDDMVAANHLNAALKILKPLGRLVAIIGSSMGMDRKKYSGWWGKISEEYAIRAVVGVSGKEYRKYGTTYDTLIVVIDKCDWDVEPIVTDAKSIADLIDILEPVRTIERKPHVKLEAIGTTASSKDATPVDESPRIDVGTDTGPIESANPIDGNVGGSLAVVVPANDEHPPEPGEISDAVFEPYSPQKLRIAGAKPHPTPLVQSAAMASVLPPDPTYTPMLDQRLIADGLLSDAQLEAITYAGQAHQEWLPNGQRKGFFVGDGCVAGETKIFDPITGTETEIKTLAERGEPIKVLSLSITGFIVTDATAPFLKGEADLFKVTLASGRTVIVTDNHKFLTPQGWMRIVDGLAAGHSLASAEAHQSSSLECNLSTRIEDVRHSTRKPEDCLGDYSSDLYRYDGQLPPGLIACRVSAPLLVDALERILA